MIDPKIIEKSFENISSQLIELKKQGKCNHFLLALNTENEDRDFVHASGSYGFLAKQIEHILEKLDDGLVKRTIGLVLAEMAIKKLTEDMRIEISALEKNPSAPKETPHA